MIFFECYADEAFLKYLGFSSKDLSGGHSFGRSNVSRKLKKTTDSFGLIDEDPLAPQDDYLRYLLSLKPVYADNHLHFSIDSKRNNKILILKPDLEGLVLKIANDNKIDLRDTKYNLSSDKGRLHDLLQTNFKKRKKFIEFISDVSGHKTIVKLKELIKY